MEREELQRLIEDNRELPSYRWMSNAIRYFGVTESSRRSSNPQIIQFFASTMGTSYTAAGTTGRRRSESRISGVVMGGTAPVLPTSIGTEYTGIDDGTTPWCSSFVNHVMLMSGYLGTRGLTERFAARAARSWLSWGQPIALESAQFGAIIIVERADSMDGNHGHVGFFVGREGTGFKIFGGNQRGGQVNVSIYDRRLLGIVMPVS